MADSDCTARSTLAEDRDAFGHWLSGFVDGEASFLLRYAKDGRRHGWCPHSEFQIGLRDDDSAILRAIDAYWNAQGRFHRRIRHRLVPHGRPQLIYRIHRVAILQKIIIPHFLHYPLRAKKSRDFLIWKEGVELHYRVSRRKRRRLGEGYRGGRMPSWTKDERQYYRELCQALKEVRSYCTPPQPVPDLKPPIPEVCRDLFADLE